jgi:hypothetical protein
MVEYTTKTPATTKKSSAMTEESALAPNPVSLQSRYRPNRTVDPTMIDVELCGHAEGRNRVAGDTTLRRSCESACSGSAV